MILPYNKLTETMYSNAVGGAFGVRPFFYALFTGFPPNSEVANINVS